MKNSFLARTGQLWKLHTGFGLVALGLALMLATQAAGHATPDQVVAGVVVGVGSGLAGVILLFGFVRCPKCRERLLWTAASTGSTDRWLLSLLRQQACPACGFVPNDFSAGPG